MVKVSKQLIEINIPLKLYYWFIYFSIDIELFDKMSIQIIILVWSSNTYSWYMVQQPKLAVMLSVSCVYRPAVVVLVHSRFSAILQANIYLTNFRFWIRSSRIHILAIHFPLHAYSLVHWMPAYSLYITNIQQWWARCRIHTSDILSLLPEILSQCERLNFDRN